MARQNGDGAIDLLAQQHGAGRFEGDDGAGVLDEVADAQIALLADGLVEKPTGYRGSVTSTKLKVAGLDVFSAGDFMGAAGTETIVLNDVTHGTYKKLVIAAGRLTGAVLVGDAGDALWYLELIRSREPIASIRNRMMFGRSLAFAAEAA